MSAKSPQNLPPPGSGLPKPAVPNRAGATVTSISPPQVPPPAVTSTRPAAGRARFRGRHLALALSFVLMVLAPLGASMWYLYAQASDQYASTVGFSVRKEETNSPIELLGGLTELSGSSSSDTDILYEYLQSQRLVADLDNEIGLKDTWSRSEFDPIFAFDPSGSIEDLLQYWRRTVRIQYDRGAGLIEIRVLAFAPDDATAIATAIFEKSALMINELSAIAREDSIRYAAEELQAAVDRLKVAREAVTLFRNRHQLVDPAADIQMQSGLLSTLEGRLAETLIELDLLVETTRAGDPRISQAERRIAVIENRIAAERSKLGLGDGADGGQTLAPLVGEYERLMVDREFAEQTYLAARATYDAAQAEARRKSRYLAAYLAPTRAETARFPERGTLSAMVALFLMLGWAVMALVTYALKDRR